MTRRKLNAEEKELWQRVAAKTERLHPQKQFDPEDFVTPTPAPKSRAKPVFEVLPTRHVATSKNGRTSASLAPTIMDQVKAMPVQMDKKSFGQLKRGKLRPEGKLDLHGMTQDRAHPALTGFIMKAHAQGKRLVLVVTGKGKNRDDGGPIPVRFGVLRHQVPQWLSAPPLSSVVLQVSQAHLRHGGEGAYYVYLRRAR